MLCGLDVIKNRSSLRGLFGRSESSKKISTFNVQHCSMTGKCNNGNNGREWRIKQLDMIVTVSTPPPYIYLVLPVHTASGRSQASY